ncbi:MAG: DUF2167 domain-containing protein [Bacteroidetes bacterium]|nr:MAG: DUF2167 domain-containing protein [Bacteroidota bacterium]
MKKILLGLAMLMLGFPVFAQDELPQSSEEETVTAEEINALLNGLRMQDSLVKGLQFKTGQIQLGNDLGTLTVPKGYTFLDATDTRTVLVDLWGNPPSVAASLGMLVPEGANIMGDSTFVFDIEYDPMGYVEDDDAEDIDYDDLLKDLIEETNAASIEREKEGFGTMSLIGWASKPYYDSDKKVLHWAKELNFDDAEANTLNYNIRILGRKGVLVMNAISGMNVLDQVKQDIPEIIGSFQFAEGMRYADFDSNIDEVAAWTVGGLVAGKVLAKTGIFVLLLKFWKVIAVGFVAGGAALWKKIKSDKQAEA